MTSAQHHSKSNEHGTPLHILEMEREVFGGQIGFDPFSSPEFQANVRAVETSCTDGMNFWPHYESVHVNPPGGKWRNRSMAGLCWAHMLRQKFGHLIWVAFNIEQLSVLQSYGPADPLSFPVCIPRKRLRFLRPDGSEGASPPHASAIIYVPGDINRSGEFANVFSRIGSVKL